MVDALDSRYFRRMDYYEDVTPGQELVIGSHTPSKEEIISFARQWDPQPFHLDEEAGRQSVMGGLSASSCHTYAISALVYSKSVHKLKTAAMLGMHVRFPTPVRPQQELTLIETYLDKRESKSRSGFGIVTSRTCLRNPAGEDVMIMESNFLVELRGETSTS